MDASKTPDFRDRQVCVAGMGYVGLTLAVAMAEAGLQVLGVERDPSVCAGLQAGEPHFFEFGLREALARLTASGRLSFTTQIPADCLATVFVIAVGTPLGADARVRHDMVERVAHDIAAVRKPGDLVILRSTVQIGTTRSVVLPILQRSGQDVEIAFCPERTQQGAALVELRHLPQIVGGLTPEATQRAARLFRLITPNIVEVSSPETAEMIKLVDNTSRDVAFAYANEISRMCEGVGVSAPEVIRAAKRDYPRAHLFMPGPVGGPCLTKDPHILLQSAPSESDGSLTAAARQINAALVPDTVRRLVGYLQQQGALQKPQPLVSILGLAFKGRPVTDDLRGSTAVELVQTLHELLPRARVQGFDAVASAKGLQQLGVAPLSTVDNAFAGADLVIIHNNHAHFEDLPLGALSGAMASPAYIYDFWNLFDARALTLAPGRHYLGLGACSLA